MEPDVVTEAAGEATEPKQSSGGRKKAAKPKQYRVRFKGNRTFELKVGRKRFTFGPHGSEVLDADIVEHEDFKQVRYLFTVKEA